VHDLMVVSVQNTKVNEIRFHALVDDAMREVRFERMSVS
jgi:hypothetical protein